MTFADAHKDLDALTTWLQENQESSAPRFPQDAVNKSIELCTKWEIEIEIKRVCRKKLMPRELATDDPLTPPLDMKRKLLAAIDRIVEEVHSRSARLQEIDSRFGILLHTKDLFSKDEDEISQICMDMDKKKFDEDISQSELCQEVQDLKFLVKNRIPETAPELLSFIDKYGAGCCQPPCCTTHFAYSRSICSTV